MQNVFKGAVLQKLHITGFMEGTCPFPDLKWHDKNHFDHSDAFVLNDHMTTC
jgi:hypothetical protein